MSWSDSEIGASPVPPKYMITQYDHVNRVYLRDPVTDRWTLLTCEHSFDKALKAIADHIDRSSVTYYDADGKRL